MVVRFVCLTSSLRSLLNSMPSAIFKQMFSYFHYYPILLSIRLQNVQPHKERIIATANNNTNNNVEPSRRKKALLGWCNIFLNQWSFHQRIGFWRQWLCRLTCYVKNSSNFPFFRALCTNLWGIDNPVKQSARKTHCLSEFDRHPVIFGTLLFIALLLCCFNPGSAFIFELGGSIAGCVIRC